MILETWPSAPEAGSLLLCFPNDATKVSTSEPCAVHRDSGVRADVALHGTRHRPCWLGDVVTAEAFPQLCGVLTSQNKPGYRSFSTTETSRSALDPALSMRWHGPVGIRVQTVRRRKSGFDARGAAQLSLWSCRIFAVGTVLQAHDDNTQVARFRIPSALAAASVVVTVRARDWQWG